jgi:hypothetical protein
MSSSCDHCLSSPAKYECQKCGLFAYCSYDCSDTHALEHARVCYNVNSRDPAYLQKHLQKCLAYADAELHPEIYHLIDNMHVDKAHALLIEAKTSTFKKKPSLKAKMARRKKSSPKIGRRGRSKSPKTPKKGLFQKKEKSASPKTKRGLFGRSRSRSSSSEKSPKRTLFKKKDKSASPKTKRSMFGRSRSSSPSDSSSSASPRTKKTFGQKAKSAFGKARRSLSRSRSRSSSADDSSSSTSASPRSKRSSFTQKAKDKARVFRDKARDFQQAVRNYRSSSRSPSPVSPRTNVIYTQPQRPSTTTIVVPPAQPQQIVVLPQTIPKPIVVRPSQEEQQQTVYAPSAGLIACWEMY